MKKSVKGSVIIATSALFFGSYGIWARLMGSSFDPFSQSWVRGIILLIILVSFGLFTKAFTKIKRKDIKWFLIFSIVGGLNTAPYFYGFQHLSIGTATLLFYLALAVTSYILGPLFFKEKLTSIKYTSLVLAIIGLFIIYKFALLPQQIIPAIITLIAGTMGGVEVVFSKKISSTYSQVQLLVSNYLAMTLGNAFINIFVGISIPHLTNYVAWTGELGYVFAMLFAMLSVIVGFKYVEPSVGGIIGLLEAVFAAVFGVIFFKELLSIQLLTGGLLILVAAGLSDGVNLIKSHMGHVLKTFQK